MAPKTPSKRKTTRKSSLLGLDKDKTFKSKPKRLPRGAAKAKNMTLLEDLNRTDDTLRDSLYAEKSDVNEAMPKRPPEIKKAPKPQELSNSGDGLASALRELEMSL